MSREDALTYVLVTFLGVMVFLATRRLWRGNRAGFDNPHPLWPLSDRAWRAYVRSLPLFGVTFPVALVLGTPTLTVDGAVHGWRRTLALAGIGILSLTILLQVTIVMFNRPRALVPRSRRHERGMLALMRDHDGADEREPEFFATVREDAPDWVAPVASGGVERGLVVYRDQRQLLAQLAGFSAMAVGMVACALVVLGFGAAGWLTAAVFVVLSAREMYRAIGICVIAEDAAVTVVGPRETTVLEWDLIERFEMLHDAAGRRSQVVARLVDGDGVRLHALEGTPVASRSQAARAERVVGELNLRLQRARERRVPVA